MRRSLRSLPFAAAVLLVGWAPAPESPAGIADRIAAALATVPDDDFSGLGRSIWIGAADPAFADGGPLHAASPEVARPAASAIKTAYLVELFSDRADALGAAVPGAAEVLGDREHPAISHFDSETRAEIREHLETADAETVGRYLIRGSGISNAVYNAAANLTTAFLGGPPELTRRIQARHPDFAGIHSRRYMLAARDVTGDNEATAASLAAVLASIARGDTPGVSPEIHRAMRDILFLEETADGDHFHKGGSLNSDPITRVLSGFFERPGEPAGRQLVYVFMAEIPGPGDLEPVDAGRRLQDHLEALRAAALPVARQWLDTLEESE